MPTLVMPTGRLVFDIPSQPLAHALRVYSSATRMGVLVDGELTAGRYSTALAAMLPPEEALRNMLTGTGLAVHYASPSAFTLVPERNAVRPSTGQDQRLYFLAVQVALKRALCQNEQTRPGHYRMALRLWIDVSGRVEHVEFLSPSDENTRDSLISASIRTLVVEVRPPAGLPRPVTVVIDRRASGQDTECSRRVTGIQR